PHLPPSIISTPSLHDALPILTMCSNCFLAHSSIKKLSPVEPPTYNPLTFISSMLYRTTSRIPASWSVPSLLNGVSNAVIIPFIKLLHLARIYIAFIFGTLGVSYHYGGIFSTTFFIW